MKRILRVFVLAASMIGASGVEAQVPVGPPTQNRPVLERQLRARVAEITRKRLQLDDAQMSKLAAVNAKYAPQLGKLAGDERATRQQLRQQRVSAAPDQNVVSGLLDNVLKIQRQRLSLLESEQNDLAEFLTPVQRAKYMGLQAQIRKRAEQLRGMKRPPAGGRAGSGLPR